MILFSAAKVRQFAAFSQIICLKMCVFGTEKRENGREKGSNIDN